MNPISKELKLKKLKEIGIFKEWIRILKAWIQIQILVWFAQIDGFELPFKRFKSQVKKKVKLKAMDSNLRKMDSIPL